MRTYNNLASRAGLALVSLLTVAAAIMLTGCVEVPNASRKDDVITFTTEHAECTLLAYNAASLACVPLPSACFSEFPRPYNPN